MRALCVLGALCVVAQLPSTAHADRSCLGSVCIEAGEEGEAVVFHAINPSEAPVSVRISFQTTNLEPYPELPELQVVPAGGLRKVGQFLPRNAYSGWSYRYAWSWVIGDPSARHDNGHRYRMPFGGSAPRKVSQGNGELFSHNGLHRYAFDFAMPIGTPILAARSGTVVLVSDGYTKSGVSDDYLSKANAIYVLHSDRTIATYAHLDPGAGVRPGMRVRVGDLIGFSGNTGYSTGPHLHFAVWKPGPDNRAHTLPILFYSREHAAGLVPETGDWLDPGCHADGRPCGPEELPAEPEFEDRRTLARSQDGACHCPNGSTITTHLPCRMVCPRR